MRGATADTLLKTANRQMPRPLAGGPMNKLLRRLPVAGRARAEDGRDRKKHRAGCAERLARSHAGASPKILTANNSAPRAPSRPRRAAATLLTRMRKDAGAWGQF